MATEYITGLIVVVTAALRDTANQFIAAHTDAGDNPAARLLNISVPLSASGVLPATHFGCQWVAMRPVMRTHIEGRRAALAAALRNQVFLFDERTTTFDAAIATLGLQRIR
jgi:ABC-type spermidine/putrescine transport system permease subunit I